MKKLTLIDNTNELKELINEFSFYRVILIDNLFPGSSIIDIEKHLFSWKEESLIHRNSGYCSSLDNSVYIEKIGFYFAPKKKYDKASGKTGFESSMDCEKQIHEDYRKKFGCKNVGEVCWSEVCVNVENMINEVRENVGK